MTQPVRFAVVGAQGYSQSYLTLVGMLEQEGLAQLAASMMIDTKDHPDQVKALEEKGVQVFDDYQRMLDACRDTVDIVGLPVPIHLHARMAVAALRGGYHVLVEKPVAGSLQQVDDVISARDLSGRKCAVGFQEIYSPAIQALKRIIVEGKLGQVKRMRMMALWPRDPAYYARNHWAGRLHCSGQPVFDSPFNNALAHQIMNMLYLASPHPGQAAYPKQVRAELYRAYDIESFDTGCLRVLTDGGTEIIAAATHACTTTSDPVTELEAEKATVSWSYGGHAIVTYLDGRTDVIRQQDPRQHMFRELAETMGHGLSSPLCTLEIARAHVACVQEIHKSALIQTIPAALLQETESGQRNITGVERAIAKTFATRQLFSEMGITFQ